MGENFKKVTRQFQLISDMKILCFHTVFFCFIFLKKSLDIFKILCYWTENVLIKVLTV